jgi:catechol 2,3-dioxygenase-like lactoylglutathione lyase family enzyme
MFVQGVSHIAIGVRDMDASLGFYRDVLGLRVDFDDIEVMGNGSQRRGVYLRYGDSPVDTFIVLDQQLGTRPEGDPADLFQVGVHHFGMWVEDVDAAAARARAAGHRVIAEPRDVDTIKYGEAPGGTIRYAFLLDPDGNTVQCEQRIEPADQPVRE